MRKIKKSKLTQLIQTREKGKKIYYGISNNLVKKGLKGKHIAIEPDSGEIYIGENGLQALEKAMKDNPSKTFYMAKIGYKVSAMLRRLYELTINFPKLTVKFKKIKVR